MAEKGSARHSCHYDRANGVHSHEDTAIIPDRPWTKAECRAMEIALGGGFMVLAVLEVIFGW